jgi:hypothetical protein
MAKKKLMKNKCDVKCDCKMKPNGGCFIYGLGVLGSAIYFISHTSGFWNVVLAILKSIVWPVFVTMKILGM